MKRFLFYLGVWLVTISVPLLFLLMLQPGFAYGAIHANPATLATIVTAALLFTGGFGVTLVAKTARKEVVTNTPGTWLIIGIVASIGILLSFDIILELSLVYA